MIKTIWKNFFVEIVLEKNQKTVFLKFFADNVYILFEFWFKKWHQNFMN